MEIEHQPVMVEEVLQWLDPRPDGDYLDLTLGGGGHARAILRANPTCRVLGVDRDREALERAAAEMHQFGERFRAVHSRFDVVDEVEGGPAEASFHGVVLDLGMSSQQVGDARRGFSFQREGALDLRMDPSEGETAAELLQRLPERELAELLYRLGGERRSRAIARAIAKRRRSAPIRTTTELSELILRVVGRRKTGGIHPATRAFQALRMAVNDELGCLARVLPKAVGWLRAQGRLVVISFHSGEDRVVKRFLRDAEREGAIRRPFRKPKRPRAEEIERNRRSRSARLRVGEVTGAGRAD